MFHLYSSSCSCTFTTAMIPQVQVAATNVASYFSDAITNDKVVNEGIKDENGITQDMMKNGKYIPIDEKLQIKVLLYISKNYLSQIHVYQFIIEWKKLTEV